MAALTTEQRAQLLRGSKEATAALMEDIPYLRESVSHPFPKRAALRRASGILRRLLTDRDLQIVATPRLDRIKLKQFDNQAALQRAVRFNAAFFAAVGVDLGGTEFRCISLLPHAIDMHEHRHELENIKNSMDRTIEVRIDNFLSEKVLCFFEHWTSRRAVIKYVANVGSGVHSGAASDPDEIALTRIRQSVYYTTYPTPGVAFVPNAFTPHLSKEFKYSALHVDPVMAEIHSAISLLVQSPDIINLEMIISAELGVEE
jgi:hypothetical protein